MTEGTKPAARRPWHLWLVGGLSLLWNAMGALDYTMTQTRNAAWMAKFTPEQLEFYYSLPAWSIAAWAIGVWGGVVGSALLLLRRRQAVAALALSFLGAVLAMVHNYLLSSGMDSMGGPAALAFSVAIVLFALGLLVYARAQARTGALS